MNFTTPVENISGVGSAYQKRLSKLKIKTLGDFLYNFPRDYKDFSKISKIKDIKINEINSISGKVIEIKEEKSRYKKMSLVNALIEDDTASIEVIWFNQPYMTKSIKVGDEVMLSGKINISRYSVQMVSPVVEKISSKETIHTGRIVPIYSETKGITSKWIRYVLRPIIDKIKNKIPETLPEEIIKKYNLLALGEAIEKIHFPQKTIDAVNAQRRFVFEQLFLISLLNLKKREELRKEQAPVIPINLPVIKRFINSLLFDLTPAQKKCSWQIMKDMERNFPMNRLLQGDVGSGKTVVSAIAAINAVKAKKQVVLMAPTEILTKQHFKTFFNLLKNFNVNIGLLTGKEDLYYSKKLKSDTIEISRKKLLEKTSKGEIDILIGTQALITQTKTKENKVKFNNLGLIIIDEQHRFGVKQRAALSPKNEIAHLLSMTATPIPRTLTLTIWGDLDLSVIDTLPKGRKKIKTEIIEEEEKAYSLIRKEIKEGKQAFVICPRIESDEDNTSSLKSVIEEYEKLSKDIFPKLKIEMLHGKMKPKDKEKIMKNFKNKKFDILVSTSVVEVGIDIPNATIMMIEGADRFGLSQLHQFRGRVGRSDHQSYCFLLTQSKSRTTLERMRAMTKYDSGFKLSEIDLKLRGPGDFMGKRQWGMPDFVMSSLNNLEIIRDARRASEDVYPISNERLKKRLEAFEEKLHLE
ncbi:MAG: ATP-dependent DNA helicase RecG [Candidatus Paceibacterota bacterium]|jgi:ATP-dependent DNA helicase RecG